MLKEKKHGVIIKPGNCTTGKLCPSSRLNMEQIKERLWPHTPSNCQLSYTETQGPVTNVRGIN
jgi:hypothetical protein